MNMKHHIKLDANSRYKKPRSMPNVERDTAAINSFKRAFACDRH
jgi:hypothetical protein